MSESEHGNVTRPQDVEVSVSPADRRLILREGEEALAASRNEKNRPAQPDVRDGGKA